MVNIWTTVFHDAGGVWEFAHRVGHHLAHRIGRDVHVLLGHGSVSKDLFTDIHRGVIFGNCFLQ